MKKNWDKTKVIDMADSRIIKYSGETLCHNYRSPLERCETATQAIRLYKSCISWALLEKYPTKEDLLSFTTKEVLAENGVFIDTVFNGERIDDHICCVFLNCKGNITTGLNVDKAIIPMIYLSDGSDLEITTDDFLTYPISIELFYDSKVKCSRKGVVSIKNNNYLTAEDNVGFPDEALNIVPNIDNEQL